MHLKRAKRHQVKLSEQVAQIFLTCLVGNVLHVVWAGLQSSTRLGTSPEGWRSTALRCLSQVAVLGSHQEPAMLALVGFQHQEKRLGRILFFRLQVNMRAVLEGPFRRRLTLLPASLPNYWEGSQLKTLWKSGGGGASDRELTEAPVYLYPPHALKQQRLVMTFSTP